MRCAMARNNCCTTHLQVNSETDFATKTEQFQSIVHSVAAAALGSEAAGGANHAIIWYIRHDCAVYGIWVCFTMSIERGELKMMYKHSQTMYVGLLDTFCKSSDTQLLVQALGA